MTPQNHIALMGSHSTGKTTYARRLHQELIMRHPYETAALITGVARSCPLPINQATSAPAQTWIFARHLQKEIDARYVHQVDHIICDRTCLDSLAYAEAAGLSDVVDACMPQALAWLEHYTHIIYFPPTPGWLQPDGFRDTDPAYQKQIHEILSSWIEAYYIVVSYRGDDDDLLKSLHSRQMAPTIDNPSPYPARPQPGPA